MNCVFSLCEFVNVVVGGIITGIVASVLFLVLSNWLKTRYYSIKYKYLKSPNGIQNDWICYSMKNENGRIREDNPNGSTVTINHKKENIFNVRLQEKDGRIWNGQLTIVNESMGKLFFQYENEHEYGFKNVAFGKESENGLEYEFVFIIGDGKDYKNEIFRREKLKAIKSIRSY
jgi:hypothetical protein